MKTKTPEQIIEATVAHFGLDQPRLMALKRLKFEDHTEGYGKASLIMQALCLMLTNLTVHELSPILNRAAQSIHSARRKLEIDCRTDPGLRADITSILRSL